ncbi:MAG: hypothetical protein RQM90_15360 [Methanoculleus sp.]
MNYPAGGGSTTDTSSQMAHLEHIEAIERRLWNTAGTLLANSNYASNEYFLVGLSASITKKDLYKVELVQPTDRVVEMSIEHMRPVDLQIEILQQATDDLAQARGPPAW